MARKSEGPGALARATEADLEAGQLHDRNDNTGGQKRKALTRQQPWRQRHPLAYASHLHVATVAFERVALTGGQMREYGLPTAPPKATVGRSKAWTGGTCQLEALPPNVISDILRAAIQRRIHCDILAIDQGQEETDRCEIQTLLMGCTP